MGFEGGGIQLPELSEEEKENIRKQTEEKQRAEDVVAANADTKDMSRLDSFAQAAEPINPEAPKKVDVNKELEALDAQFGKKNTKEVASAENKDGHIEVDVAELRPGDVLVSVEGEKDANVFKEIEDDYKYHPVEILSVGLRGMGGPVSIDFRYVGTTQKRNTLFRGGVRMGVIRKEG